MCLQTNGEQHCEDCSLLPPDWKLIDNGHSFCYEHASGRQQIEMPRECLEAFKERLREQARELASQDTHPDLFAKILPMPEGSVHPTKMVVDSCALYATPEAAACQSSETAAPAQGGETAMLVQRHSGSGRPHLAWVQLASTAQTGWLLHTQLYDFQRQAAPPIPQGLGWVNLEHMDGRPDVFFWHARQSVGTYPASGGIPAGSPAVLLEECGLGAGARQVAWGGMRVWLEISSCYLDTLKLAPRATYAPPPRATYAPPAAPAAPAAPVSGALAAPTGAPASEAPASGALVGAAPASTELIHADLKPLARDTSLPDSVPLPCNDPSHWDRILAAYPENAVYSGPDDLVGPLKLYGLGGPSLHPGTPPSVQGLHAVASIYGAEFPALVPTFYARGLPWLISQMKRLPALAGEHGGLPYLRQGERRTLVLERRFALSLLANMFLCTFDGVLMQDWQTNTLNLPSFKRLFARNESVPQEIAKLAMFMHASNRLSDRDGEIRGTLVIERVVGAARTGAAWLQEPSLLLPLTVLPKNWGFEDLMDPRLGQNVAHADFANMFIGGGVFWGGCVQEEIRFAICPELCVALIVAPVLQPEESLLITGAERFSAYSGYAFKLRFAGDHRDLQPREGNGTIQSCILAMDAQDFRGRDSSFSAQLSPTCLLRDLNKAVTAFGPSGFTEHFPKVATGNWGCGAFRGNARLKALVQWIAASAAGRQLRYYPFSEDFGAELHQLSGRLCARGVTAGQLTTALVRMRCIPNPSDLFYLADKLLAPAPLEPGSSPKTEPNSKTEPDSKTEPKPPPSEPKPPPSEEAPGGRT